VDDRDVPAALEGAEGSRRGVDVGLKPDMDGRVLGGGGYGISKGAEGVRAESGDERKWGGNDLRMMAHANRTGYIVMPRARDSNLTR
jgi:hypothetical protein